MFIISKLIKFQRKRELENLEEPGQGREAIVLKVAVTSSTLFLAFLFIDMFIDIFMTAATKLVIPYGRSTLINFELI